MKKISKKIISGYCLVTEKGKNTFFFEEVSLSYAALYNKKPVDFISKSIDQLLPQNDRVALSTLLTKAKRTKFVTSELELQTNNNNRHFFVSVTFIENPKPFYSCVFSESTGVNAGDDKKSNSKMSDKTNDSEFVYVFSNIVQNSTVPGINGEMNIIDSDIKKTKQLLEKITQTSPSFISLYDVKADKILYSNRSILHSLGYTDGDLEAIRSIGGNNKMMFYHRDDIEKIREYERKLKYLKEGEIAKIDYRIKDAGSKWQWFHHSASVFQKAEGKQPLLTINVYENITEQKTAEEETKKKGSSMELLYSAGKEISSSLDLFEIYDRMYNIISQVADCKDLIVSSYDPVKQLIHYKYLRARAVNARIDVSGIPPIPLAPKGFGILSEVIRSGRSIIINDYDEYFKKVKTKYAVSDHGTVTVDQKGSESPNSALILPIVLEDKILGVVQIYSSNYNAYTNEQLQFVELLMHQVALANKNASIYAQAQNEIYERRIAQDNLKKSEKNLRSFAESVPDVLYKLNYSTGKYDFLSPVIENMLGYDIDEILSDPNSFSRKVILPEDLEYATNLIANHIKHGKVNKPVNLECRMVRKDKKIIWVRDSIKFEYKKGTITAAIGAMSDITDEKLQEEYRRKRDERIINFQASLLELSKLHGLGFDENIRIISDIAEKALSNCIVSIWLFSSDESEILCISRIDPVSKAHTKNVRYKTNEHADLFRILRSDEYISVKNNKSFETAGYINILLQPQTYASLIVRVNFHGRVAGFLCVESNDEQRTEWLPEEYDFAVSVSGFITLALESEERFQAENEIKKSLKDKEMLLREIHHRVKNNLAVISSLLYLQSRKLPGGLVNDALVESQNRIKSMVMIHEKLYKSEDLSSINYSEYVSELASTLFISYMIDPGKIKLELDIGKILLDTDDAIHCGLIINELVSNTIKHAFPGNATGVLCIKFHEISEHVYRLIVQDNGKGLKSDFNIAKQDTLGMQLLVTLVEQLNGELNIISENGTTFDIRFSLNNKKQS